MRFLQLNRERTPRNLKIKRVILTKEKVIKELQKGCKMYLFFISFFDTTTHEKYFYFSDTIKKTKIRPKQDHKRAYKVYIYNQIR